MAGQSVSSPNPMPAPFLLGSSFIYAFPSSQAPPPPSCHLCGRAVRPPLRLGPSHTGNATKVGKMLLQQLPIVKQRPTPSRLIRLGFLSLPRGQSRSWGALPGPPRCHSCREVKSHHKRPEHKGQHEEWIKITPPVWADPVDALLRISLVHMATGCGGTPLKQPSLLGSPTS